MNIPLPPSIEKRFIEEEMQTSYIDYAMSVIVSRALPDVRDGLKPVHRRILYSMYESGFYADKPHRKSARIVGDVLGKYHPHDSESIYGAMVRMAQPHAMGLILIDGQGNFGSMDGDKAAASRYTEARLNLASQYLLEDYDKDTVSFAPNYDNTLSIPTVLPARYPNLLVNGAGGIAVGMATNIPTHNLGEVMRACSALLRNPLLTLEEVMEYIPGPDFPTGGEIAGYQGIRNAYKTGKGSIIIRATCHIEEVKKDRQAIIVTEIPYQVNKARMIEKIAELIHEKNLEGISDLRDESDRQGVRVVIEVKRDTTAEVVLNRLYAQTPLQTSFGINVLALVDNKPVQLGLIAILQHFLTFREQVVIRRTQFFLRKARERAHIVCSLLVAVSNIDIVVGLIKSSPDVVAARHALLSHKWSITESIEPYLLLLGESIDKTTGIYQFTESQARSILELRLQRLTGLEQNKLIQELESLAKEIRHYQHLLENREALVALMIQEFEEIEKHFSQKRLTKLSAEVGSMDEGDFIEREDMIVTFSVKGYIKRVPLSTYRAQKRGGRGRSAMSTHEEDILSQVFVANTHTQLLFFTSAGRAFQLKVYELPLGSPQSKGKPLVMLFPLEKGETLSTILPIPETVSDEVYITFVTSAGNIRRNALKDFANIRANGKLAMKLEEEGEKLIAVQLCDGSEDVLLTSSKGRCIRFSVQEVRQFAGRSSTGVRGIRLEAGDHVVSMTMLSHTDFSPEERELYLRHMSKARKSEEEDPSQEEGDENICGASSTLSPEKIEQMAQEEEFILTVSESGLAKRTSAYAYRRTGRGGAGIAAMDTTIRVGRKLQHNPVIQSFPVKEQDQILMLTNHGQLMRCGVHEIRIASRKTKGVIVFRLQKEEKIVSVIPFADWNPDETEIEDIAE